MSTREKPPEWELYHESPDTIVKRLPLLERYYNELRFTGWLYAITVIDRTYHTDHASNGTSTTITYVPAVYPGHE